MPRPTRLSSFRLKMIEALDTESREAEAAMARFTNMNAEGWTPELREFRELGQRVTIKDYVAAATEERHVDGAASEYNKQRFWDVCSGRLPAGNAPGPG